MSEVETLTDIQRVLWYTLYNTRTESGWYGQPECEEVARLLAPVVEEIIRERQPEGEEVEEVRSRRCGFNCGERPFWMSPGQYDPCPCIRPRDHRDKHACAHDKPRDGLPHTAMERRTRTTYPDRVTEWEER